MNRVVNNVKPTRRRQRRYKQYQMVDICNCGCNFVHSKMYLCICICDGAEILVRPWLRVYWEAAGWWESLQLLNISIADKEVYLCALYFSLKFYGSCFLVFAWEKNKKQAYGGRHQGRQGVSFPAHPSSPCTRLWVRSFFLGRSIAKKGNYHLQLHGGIV